MGESLPDKWESLNYERAVNSPLYYVAQDLQSKLCLHKF